MKKTFWLPDVNYKVKDHQPEMWIWGIDEEGKAAVAKKVQEKVLEIILKKQSPEKAAQFVRQYIVDLRGKKVSYRDLII